MADQRVERNRQMGADRTVSRRSVLKAGAAAAVAATAFGVGGGAKLTAAQGTPGVPGAILSGRPDVPPAYEQLPKPYKTVNVVPGKGGKIRILSMSYTPPITPHDKNVFWQELEKRLGVRIEPNLIPQASYGEKTAAILASGDLPELFYINPTGSTGAAGLSKAIQQGAFIDLTDYLSGDGLKDYPNLAKYPDYLWTNVAIKNKIYGVPKPVLRNNDITFYRADWAKKLGYGEVKTTDELKNMLVDMSKKDPDGDGKADTWGTGAYAGGWNMWFFSEIFNVPNVWKLNSDGTLTNQIETPEFKQALDFARQLYAAGGFYPDSASTTFQQDKDNFVGGKVGMHDDGFIAFFGPTGIRTTAKQVNPTVDLQPMIPFAANGGKPVSYNTAGFFGFTGIPASVGKDKGKLKELLAIMNYLCAPFGSEEAMFLHYGVEGTDYKVGADGAPEVTDQGKADTGALVYPFLSEDYFYYPGQPGEATYAQKVNKQMAEIGIDNPVQNVYSPTNTAKAGELNQLALDRRTAIVTGRSPLSALDDWIKDWKSRGGDDIRKELEAGLKG